MGAKAQPVREHASGQQDETVVTPVSRQPLPGQMLQPGYVLEQRFVITRLLGSGGMGDVYEAEDLRLNRARIALKTMRAEYAADDNARERFQHEVLLARSIAHPNVCPMYEMFSSEAPQGEIWFLTMKLLSGETLASRLAKRRIVHEEAIRISHEIAAGLDAIHELGIVHRDLKPGNIFLETWKAGERAVLTDFGLARVCSDAPSLTDAGQVVGTPSYIAPEVRAGKPATPRSDVYSFGVVVYEMVMGGRPDFQTTLALDTASENAQTRRFRSTIARCLALDPAQRFASASDAVVALERALEGLPLVTRRNLLATGATAAAGVIFCWSQREEIGRLLHSLPKPRRVAVLPAADLHARSEDASLLNGVLESVSAQLARAEKLEPDLFVVPSRYLRRQNVSDLSQALGLFGANLALSGSLAHVAESVTLILRLTETSTGKLLRHAEVSAPVAALYALGGLAAQRAALLLEVRRKDLGQLPLTADTANADAYAAYERGRGLLGGYGLPVTDQAIAELQKAVDLDPAFARAWAALSEAYSQRFHLTKDVAALDLADRNSAKALALAPDLSTAYSSRAKFELYKGLYPAAIEDAQKASRLDPDNADALIALAETYRRSGKLDLVEQTYEKLSKDRPNNWFVLNDWGDYCIDQANYARAEKLFREATLLAPRAALPWRNLGAVYLETGQLEDANRALNRSVSLLPSGEAYANLGTALFWLGKYRSAADAYVKAVNLNPQHPHLWRDLGDAYQMIPGMNGKATAAWKKAADLTAGLLDANPNNLDELVDLALYKAKLGETTAALTLLRRVDTFPALTVEQLFNESVAYELSGRRDTALQLLRKSIRLGYSPADILHAPELASLRRDRRFKDLELQVAAR